MHGSGTGATAEELGDVEVNEIGVVEDDRFDAAFDLLAFMAVHRFREQCLALVFMQSSHVWISRNASDSVKKMLLIR